MTKETVEIDFMQRVGAGDPEKPYSFSRDLNALMGEMSQNADKQYVINAQQILALDSNEKDVDKKAIRLMHLLAQVQQGVMPANVEIQGFDRACFILREMVLGQGKRDRVQQTTHAYLSAGLRDVQGNTVAHHQKDDVMREQFQIIWEWGDKWKTEVSTAKKDNRQSQPLSLRVVEDGKMVAERGKQEENTSTVFKKTSLKK